MLSYKYVFLKYISTYLNIYELLYPNILLPDLNDNKK